MSGDEEQRLRDIERSLTREDPRFAERISAFEPWDARSVAACSNVIAVSGCALALLGLLLGSAFGLLGVLMATIGFALRLTVPTTAQLAQRHHDDGGESGTGHDGARI